MDSLFVGLVEWAVEWIDDRYGRAAAWAAAVILPIGLVCAMIAFVVFGFGWLF